MRKSLILTWNSINVDGKFYLKREVNEVQRGYWKEIKVEERRAILTVARFVVSILFPGIHSPFSFFWSSLFAATTLKKFKSAQSVSRLGVGRSWMRCWRASCCNRLFLISRKTFKCPLISSNARKSENWKFVDGIAKKKDCEKRVVQINLEPTMC